MTTLIKICGIKTPEAMTAAMESGADFIGLVFHKPSPRFVEIEVAAYLSKYAPPTTKIVGLFVDPTDEILTQTLQNVRIDMIQLHGDESIERVAEIRGRFQKPIIKAIGISSRDDLQKTLEFSKIADWLLLDAPNGGSGQPFDWQSLSGFTSPVPWFLAGGLTPKNVAQAIQITKPNAVDVSSGVENERGVKDKDKINEFIKNAEKLTP